MTRYWVDPKDAVPTDDQDVILAVFVNGEHLLVSLIGIRRDGCWWAENFADGLNAEPRYERVYDDDVAAWRALPGSATLIRESNKEGKQLD